MNARFCLAAVSLIALFGCTRTDVTPRSSGSLAISRDDALLFVADADHDRLTVINTATKQVVGHTPVGTRPERVLVAPDGAVYVSNRGSRSVSRLSADGMHVEATSTVGAEPVGLSLTPDGKRLLVANSMSGSLSVLDAQTLEPQAQLQVGGQPWAVTVLGDGHRAYVTDFASGEVKLADLDTGGVTQSVELTQATSAECPNGVAPARQPAQAADVILSPEGDRAYVAHVQSRTNGTFGQQTSLSFAVAPALSTIDTTQNTTFQEQQNSGLGDDPNSGFPAALLATNLNQACQWVNHNSGMDAPSSLVVDGMGEWIFVADHNSNAIAVVSSTRRNDVRFRVPERGIADVVAVGARPTGIAVSGDLKKAYVHNALDYTVSVVENVGGKLTTSATIPFAQSDLAPEVDRGRRLFYSAVDPRVTQPELGGVSCSSCHPEGRTDGLTWVLPSATGNWWEQTASDPRNTPALWGVTHTAPYHWDGSSTDLSAFSTGMVTQMGGGGLDARDVNDLTAFMSTLKVPDHPALGAQAPGLIARGQQLFAASCANCHSGDQLTDGLKHPAGTYGPLELDTPSLRGAFATAPYLHDGSAPTLRHVLTGYAQVQGHDQSALSSADLEALEAYVDAQ